MIAENNKLFDEIKEKNEEVKAEAAKGTPEGDKKAGLAADEMSSVVDKVSSRWLDSIDKEEPEIAEEFLRKMKDAVAEIHKTEGFPYGKVANARNQDADWLTKIVQANAKMQAAIPPTPSTKGLRKAIYDSWKRNENG